MIDRLKRMNIEEWLTPARTVALTLVLVEGGLQVYALAKDGYFIGQAGIVLLVLGMVVEILGHGLVNDK